MSLARHRTPHGGFHGACTSGPAARLVLLDADGGAYVASYPYVHLARGTLLGELGRVEEARASLALAEAHARNPHERTQSHARSEALTEARPGPTPAPQQHEERR